MLLRRLEECLPERFFKKKVLALYYISLLIAEYRLFMKKYRNLIFYLTTIGVFFILIFLTLDAGKTNLEIPSAQTILTDSVEGSAWSVFLYNLLDSIATPTIVLLGQLIVILIVVKLFGWLCKLIGQTAVIGEIFAGVVLGPSFLGHYFPQISEFLFPVSSLGNIGLLSQIGLVLFMFIVGMELDLKTVKNRAENAVIISHASIIFPFSLGIFLAYFLYEEFTHAHVNFLSFALFMGIAMSITAFPVLARIIQERGINKQPIGPVVVTCAAIDDITAWCLLAAVIAIVKAGSLASSVFVILAAVMYVIVMFKVVRPVLKRVVNSHHSRRNISKPVAATFFIVLFISSYITELIGIHALFGAFMAGVMMPTDVKFRNLLIEKIEYVSLIVLLPLFFVYTGLRTEIGLLNTTHLWIVCGMITLVAVVGKFCGSAFAARFVGLSWKDSCVIGTLMNTRGLMELVVLNIGLDLGILSPEIFAMMVIMALATTFMTSPSLSFINKIFRKEIKAEENTSKKFRVLVPFASPETGKRLLRIADFISKRRPADSEVTMLHATEGSFLHQYNVEDEEDAVFAPILSEAKRIGKDINAVYDISNDSQKRIIRVANKEEYDFVLIGSRGGVQPEGEDNLLGHFVEISRSFKESFRKLLAKFIGGQRAVSPFEDRTRLILSKVDAPIGIFIDRGFVDIQKVLVPVLDEDDTFVGSFMEGLAKGARITLWDHIQLSDNSIDFVRSVKELKKTNQYLFQQWNNHILVDEGIVRQFDLVIISLESWKLLREKRPELVQAMPSTLILSTP